MHSRVCWKRIAHSGGELRMMKSIAVLRQTQMKTKGLRLVTVV